MNNNEPPQKKTPKLVKKKQAFFNTFETIPDTPKTNLLILKPQKTNPQKIPFCHVQNNPQFFINFLFFFNIQFLFLKNCALLKTL